MAKKPILANVDLSNVSQKPCWYTVVVQFNYEQKVVNNICEAIEGTEFENYFEDFYIPIKYTKEMITLADGTKKAKIHKVKGALSNYIFVKCVMNESTWNLIRTTTGVAVIPTTGGFPVAISEFEIEKMKKMQRPVGFSKEELAELQSKVNFSIF